jgi:hypothetical protein
MPKSKLWAPSLHPTDLETDLPRFIFELGHQIRPSFHHLRVGYGFNLVENYLGEFVKWEKKIILKVVLYYLLLEASFTLIVYILAIVSQIKLWLPKATTANIPYYLGI